MYEAFITLVNLGISVSWLILAVLLLRLCLKKAPKWTRGLLWALVAVRLVCPIQLESSLSVFNLRSNTASDTPATQYVQYNGKSEKPSLVWTAPGEARPAQNTPTTAETQTDAAQTVQTKKTHTTYLPPVMLVWAVGAGALLGYALISYLLLRRKTAASVRLRENIFLCDGLPSPFILGLAFPKIYLPSTLTPEQQQSVLAHERAHLKRRDQIWKPLGFFLLAVYWFNPLVWLSYVLLCRDIELACDEKVIRTMSTEEKQDYSRTLLSCSLPRHMVAACPLAFGEIGVKTRVKSILNYKKPAFWLVLTAVLAACAVAVGFLTAPKQQRSSDSPEAETAQTQTEPGSSAPEASQAALTGTYRRGETLYVDPLSSTAAVSGDDGRSYLIEEADGKLTLTVFNDETGYQDTGFDTQSTVTANWQPLTQERWEELLSMPDFAPELDTDAQNELLQLNDWSYLMRVDGEVWFASLWGSIDSAKVHSIYRLQKTADTVDMDALWQTVRQTEQNDLERLDTIFEQLEQQTVPVSLSLLIEGDMYCGSYPGWGVTNDIQSSRTLTGGAYQLSTEREQEISDQQITLCAEDDAWELIFWQGTNSVQLRQTDGSWYYQFVPEYEGEYIGDVLRFWFDEAELNGLGGGYENQELYVVEDWGQSWIVAVSESVDQLYSINVEQVSPGSAFRYAYMAFITESAVDATKLLRERGDIDENTEAFWLTVIFVPENERALNYSMAGNTGAYTGSDPDVPEGAYEYTRCGYVTRAEDGYHVKIVGTGW